MPSRVWNKTVKVYYIMSLHILALRVGAKISQIKGLMKGIHTAAIVSTWKMQFPIDYKLSKQIYFNYAIVQTNRPWWE